MFSSLTRILSFLVFLDEMLRTEGMTTIGEGEGRGALAWAGA